jgi:NAD(P)-dependent dehydrogenase (short-subunit alcohol dehydrogenase family)
METPLAEFAYNEVAAEQLFNELQEMSGIRFLLLIGGLLRPDHAGRLGRPEEAARVALFLACDDSSYVTGVDIVVIVVDGGMKGCNRRQSQRIALYAS